MRDICCLYATGAASHTSLLVSQNSSGAFAGYRRKGLEAFGTTGNEAKSKRVPLSTDRRELVLRLLIKHDYGKMKIGELKELALAAGLSAKDPKNRLVENLTNLKMYEITGQSEYLTHSADKKENAEISGNIKQEKPATQKKPAKKGFVQQSVLAKPGRTKLEGQHRTASKLSGIKSAVDSNTGLLTSIRNTSAITAVSSTATAYYSAQSAHYAAVNAHYSKINAELTDALGYMVALR